MINQIFSQIYYPTWKLQVTYPPPFVTFESMFFRRNPKVRYVFSFPGGHDFFPLFQVDQSGSQDCFPPMSGVAAAIDRYGLAEFPKLSAEELFNFQQETCHQYTLPKFNMVHLKMGGP